jgi:hypothetical protein
MTTHHGLQKKRLFVPLVLQVLRIDKRRTMGFLGSDEMVAGGETKDRHRCSRGEERTFE